MVPGIVSPLCTFTRTNPDTAKTISISIRRGSDGRSSSIVLPRDHHLAKHLERLVASDSSLLQQPLRSTDQSTENSNVVTALSSVVKYFHASSHHEAPSEALSALFSSLRPPSELSGLQVRDRVRSLPDTQTQSPSVDEHPAIHRRRERSTKHCKVLGCGNISVSRGLCRGHGGGRRCHYIGCSKSAQSRSVFCWAHGGGHRCEVESCMRSRKSKRFCADHVSLENAVPDGMRTLDLVEHPKLTGAFGGRCLPSIQEVLRNTQQSTSLTLPPESLEWVPAILYCQNGADEPAMITSAPAASPHRIQYHLWDAVRHVEHIKSKERSRWPGCFQRVTRRSVSVPWLSSVVDEEVVLILSRLPLLNYSYEMAAFSQQVQLQQSEY